MRKISLPTLFTLCGNSDWDRSRNAAESMNGFVCDSTLTQSLFGLDMNFDEDHEDDDVNDDEEELATFEEQQRHERGNGKMEGSELS